MLELRSAEPDGGFQPVTSVDLAGWTTSRARVHVIAAFLFLFLFVFRFSSDVPGRTTAANRTEVVPSSAFPFPLSFSFPFPFPFVADIAGCAAAVRRGYGHGAPRPPRNQFRSLTMRPASSASGSRAIERAG